MVQGSREILLSFVETSIGEDLNTPVPAYANKAIRQLMHDWLQNYEYRIGINVWVFIAAGAAALLIALATISFQAVKTAMANPVKALRTE